ncbi:type IV pilus modification protein PilV [Lysobacter silvisoli]|uniref:Type IV pilus modification protein PilV n=1 Tax=Lysobacter silvisoli TaxID=2293254 RepID=A0A371K5M2_9GAMM|nr:type IV pilus modification protein PilV [Lysobacter silvisoli]RDZ29215.1 type IV pilus modification protein PilV [Lysobacter silvisoli]
MSRPLPRSWRPLRRAAGGFSLIEVLVALLVLAFGLLGLAFLQTLNIRYTQSANHRTAAANLSHQVIDMMRSNRVVSRQYAALTFNSFPAAPAVAGCGRGAAVDFNANMNVWRCEVSSSLPGGQGQVTFNGDQVTVTVRWNDDLSQAALGQAQSTYVVTTRL